MKWIGIGCWGIAGWAAAAEWHVDPAAAAGGDGSAARPFATLHEAVAAMPDAAAESLVVKLAPGVHRIGSTLEITPAHTRGQPLVITGEGKAVISGGRRLTAWKQEGGRWVHEWSGRPPRELFFNGERRPRSRFPRAGWLRVEAALPDKRSGFTAQADLPRVGPGAELLFLHDWSVSRVPVASLEGRLLKTAGPVGFPAAHFVIDHFEPHPRYCLENDPAFLTEPGTWCHDPLKQVVFYLPRDGESVGGTVVETPVVTKLLRVAGTAGQVIGGVTFKGTGFQHCRWDIPRAGYAEGQATKHEPRDAPRAPGDPHGQWRFVPWAVEVEWANAVRFEECRFEHLGGSGVLLGAGTRDCGLGACVVRDVSGNGIGVGEGGERCMPGGRPWWQAAPEQAATGNGVRDSLVEACGVQFHGAVGIWVGLARETTLAGNEVRDLPYTGISVGWMWNPTPTPCGANVVEGNHIHHVMQLLSDGGGIYTLGRQPGTVLAGNWIHDVPLNAGRAESNGMFLDEGSSGLVIEGNLIHGTVRSPLRFHKAGPIEVRRNAWRLPPDTPPLRFNATDPAAISAAGNEELDDAGLALRVDAWRSAHPSGRRK